jgi:hypothetical protein
VRGLPVLAMAAACGGDGIHIEIRPGEAADVTRVELYLTDKTECSIPNTDLRCNGLVFPANGQREVAFEGDIYQVDDPTPFRADMVEGSAWFYLAPDSGEVKLSVAIGFDGDRVVGTRILTQKMDTSEGLQYFRADLRAVGMFDQGEVSATVWPEGDVPYHCVAAVEGNERVAIVPAKDPDCDFVDPARECRPTVHLANSPPSQVLEELTCATDGVVTGLGDFCLLGDTACNEADPMPVSCVPTTMPICVPDKVCKDPICARLDDECLASFADPNGTHLQCTFPMSSQAGVISSCSSVQMPPLPLGTSVCGQLVGIMPLISPLGFAPTLDITTSSGSATFQPTIAGGCGLVLDVPATGFADETEFPILEHALLKFSVRQANNTIPRDVIIPVSIEMFIDPAACGEGASCTFVKAAGERVATCFGAG